MPIQPPKRNDDTEKNDLIVYFPWHHQIYSITLVLISLSLRLRSKWICSLSQFSHCIADNERHLNAVFAPMQKMREMQKIMETGFELQQCDLIITVFIHKINELIPFDCHKHSPCARKRLYLVFNGESMSNEFTYIC